VNGMEIIAYGASGLSGVCRLTGKMRASQWKRLFRGQADFRVAACCPENAGG